MKKQKVKKTLSCIQLAMILPSLLGIPLGAEAQVQSSGDLDSMRIEDRRTFDDQFKALLDKYNEGIESLSSKQVSFDDEKEEIEKFEKIMKDEMKESLGKKGIKSLYNFRKSVTALSPMIMEEREGLKGLNSELKSEYTKLKGEAEQISNKIKTLDQKYKLLGARDSFYTRFNEFNPENEKGDKFKVRNYILPENCYLGVSTQVLDKQKREIGKYKQEGNIDLRKSHEMVAKDHSTKNWGWELNFGEGKPSLYYNSKTKRDLAKKIFEEMKSSCEELGKKEEKLYALETMRPKVNELTNKVEFFADQLCPNAPLSPIDGMNNLDQVKAILSVKPDELSVPSAFKVGTRPLRMSTAEDPIKMSLLSNGEKALAARLKILEDAKGRGDHVKVQYLAMIGDDLGKALVDELIEKRKNGVKVEVIVDALTAFMDVRDQTARKNTEKMYRKMMAYGIPVYGYGCGGLGKQLKREAIKDLKLEADITLDGRAHEKLWIVNGKKVVMGGLNIGNAYFQVNDPGLDKWRDQDVLLEGKSIVQDTVDIFDGNVSTFEKNFQSPRKDKCFNPYTAQIDSFMENHGLKSFSKEEISKIDENKQKELKALRDAEGIFIKGHDPTYKKYWRSLAVKKSVTAERNIKDIKDDIEKILDLEKDQKVIKGARIVQSRPKINERHIEELYLDMINKAKEEIILSNSYFIPSAEIKDALVKAAKRGVKVKILTNSLETNDVPPVAYLSRFYFKDLLDPTLNLPNPIEIYEWTGKQKRIENGKEVFEDKPSMGTNHGKFFAADNKVGIIGSYNFDPRSRNINSEIVMAFDDADKAKELTDGFKRDLSGYSKKVNYDEILHYRNPPSLLKALRLKRLGYYPSNISLLNLIKTKVLLEISKDTEGTW